MIFYNNQLMTSRAEAILYMVYNPEEFTNYDDHESALYIQLHELIERAIAEGDDPIMLIEEYLGVVYNSGDTIDEMATFLFQSDAMHKALWTLQTNWDTMDEHLPGNSRMFWEIDKEEAVQLYAQVTLRTYLEMLACQD